MSAFLTQLPWVIIWIVILICQDRFIRRKNWFGSLILIWVSLILSFAWDILVKVLPEGWNMDFSSRFWLLFVITAILHVLGRRRDKKAMKREIKDAYAQPAEAKPENPEEPPEEEHKTARRVFLSSRFPHVPLIRASL